MQLSPVTRTRNFVLRAILALLFWTIQVHRNNPVYLEPMNSPPGVSRNTFRLHNCIKSQVFGPSASVVANERDEKSTEGEGQRRVRLASAASTRRCLPVASRGLININRSGNLERRAIGGGDAFGDTPGIRIIVSLRCLRRRGGYVLSRNSERSRNLRAKS